MSNPGLYRALVPDAPAYRHTEGDVYSNLDRASRARAGGFLPKAAARPGLQRPALISSYNGCIDTILLAFPRYGIEDAPIAAGYQSVLRELRAGTRFVIAHHDDDHSRRTIESWLIEYGHGSDNVTFVPVPTYVDFTDWAEDSYLALLDADDDSLYLMEPWEFPRAGDALIAESVQEYAGLSAAQAPLIFQGGNCLVGDTFWLMGNDYFADTLNLLASSRPPARVPRDMTPSAFAHKLFADYVDSQRRLIVLGTRKEIPLRHYYGTRDGGEYFLDIAAEGAGTFQPIFHIDMFVTLIGRSRSGEFEVLVGSPRLADQALGTRSPFALDRVYDRIAADLAAEGMTVHRNPLVHRPTVGRSLTLRELRHMAEQPGNEALMRVVGELTAARADDDTQVKVRNWHHITWNNCLVENSEAHGRHVYLPTFGHGPYADLARIDQQMKALWEGFGYTVHMLGDFNEFARRQGVVHCIKKYLRRGH